MHDPAVDIFERARLYRGKGNECYAAKKYRKACTFYTKIVDLILLEAETLSSPEAEFNCDRDELEKDTLAAAYCNRAAALLGCGEWQRVLSDCDEVLRLGQSNTLTVKALFRRGQAHEALGDADNARRDFENALQLEPGNQRVAEAHDNDRSVLHRLVVLSRGTPEVRSRQRKGL